jgi:hypothetical protein
MASVAGCSGLLNAGFSGQAVDCDRTPAWATEGRRSNRASRASVPAEPPSRWESLSGDEQWRHERADRSFHGAAVADRVYATGRVDDGAEGVISAISGGEQVWSRTFSGEAAGPPTTADGQVYAVSRRGEVSAYASTTGDRRWRAADPALGDEVPADLFEGTRGPVAVRDGRVVVPNDEGVTVLDAATGTQQWTTPDAVEVVAGPPVVGPERVLVTDRETEAFRAFDATDGRQVWEEDPPTSPASGPVLVDGQVFYLDRRGAINRLR